MRYMFLIYSQETSDGLAPDQADRVRNAHRELMEDTKRKGILVGVNALLPTTTATTVRMNGGKAMTMDGPFAETKEQLAGYYILDCQDLDEAIDWAARIPSTCRGEIGCIEIRPVADLSKL
jgi:hypothetical protein